jgi:hypothetical protein
LLGFAVGCKVSYVFPLDVVGLWYLLAGGNGTRLSTRVRGLALLGAGAIVTGSFWYIRNWATTGNPLFPAQVGPFDGPFTQEAQARTLDDMPPRETITNAIDRARARAATRRIQPRSSPATTSRSPEARPSAAQPRATQPRATQPRPRATPRVFQRPTPSARRSPEPRRAPPPPSNSKSKGRTPQ